MDRDKQTHMIEWNGVKIAVSFTPAWMNIHGGPVAHLEIESVDPERTPLPMTETGYRSHFCDPATIMDAGGPAAFALAWIEHEAKSREWIEGESKRRQLSLF